MPVSNSSRRRSRLHLPLIALVILISLGAFALAQRRKPLAKPRLVGTTTAFPLAIKHAEGAWYWREKTKDAGESLMRTSASGSQVVAKADALPCYALAEGKLGWVTRNGHEWTIFLSALDGSQPVSLWKDTAEPMGIAIAGGNVYWLRRLPASALHSGAFASLSPSLEVVSIPFPAGKPKTVARLWESEDGEILGLHGNALFVAVYRHTPPGSFCLYRVPLDSAHPVRVAGERGAPRSILTQDGNLYWTAPSEETADSSPAVCLRRLNSVGQTETLSDWLPLSGELYETTQGVLYGDHEISTALWAIGQRDTFPEPLTLPNEFKAVAAGEGQMLLTPVNAEAGRFTFYEIPLP